MRPAGSVIGGRPEQRAALRAGRASLVDGFAQVQDGGRLLLVDLTVGVDGHGVHRPLGEELTARADQGLAGAGAASGRGR